MRSEPGNAAGIDGQPQRNQSIRMAARRSIPGAFRGSRVFALRVVVLFGEARSATISGMRCFAPIVFRILLTLAVVSTVSVPVSAQQVGGGLGTSTTVEPTPENVPETPQGPEEKTEEGVAAVPDVIAMLDAMSIEEKIAQLMFVRLNGNLAMHSVDREFVRTFSPGGVMLPVVGGAKTTYEQTSAIRALAPSSKHRIPFFIAGDGFAPSDNAGREMNRFILAPTPLTMAAAGVNEATEEFLDEFADGFARIGMNVQFGPSLTLSGDATNPYASLNTFGDSPEFTSAFGDALHAAFSKHGITYMPTGFPGGEANRSGAEPAVLLTPGPHYLERDGAPYLAAVQNGVPLLHVGNVLVPTFEEDSSPASLSKRVISMMLRGTLGYEGVVVAGPIDTPQMLTLHGPPESAEMALEAGADMILWSRVSGQIPQVIASLGRAVREGYLKEEIVDRAAERVLRAKMAMGLYDSEQIPEPKLDKLLRDNRDAELLKNIERGAITLIKNKGNVLPLTKDESTPVLMTGVIFLDGATKILEKELKSVVRFETKTAKHLTRVEDFELRRLEKVVSGKRTAVCVFDAKVNAESQAQIIKTIKAGGAKVVVILLGHPASIAMYDDADAILLTYSSSVFPEHTMETAVRILLGDAPISVLSSETPLVRKRGEEIIFNVLDVIQSPTGRLPINLPPAYTHGDFVSYPPTSIKKVRWDFGDGKSSGEERIGHAYEAPGSYTATLTVADDDGRESTGTFAIEIQ